MENLEHSKANPRKSKLNLWNPPTREVVLRILSSGFGYPLTVTKKSNPSPPQPNCTTKDRQRIKTHTTPTNTTARSNQTTIIQPTTTRCSGGGGGGGKDEFGADDIWALQSKTQTPSKRVSKTRNTRERKTQTFERENGEEDLVGSNAEREEQGKEGRKEAVKGWCGGGADMAGADWGCLGWCVPMVGPSQNLNK